MLIGFEWFVLVLSDETTRNKSEVGRSKASQPLPPPGNFIAGRPKAALLCWFFGDVRCGVLLIIIILVIYI